MQTIVLLSGGIDSLVCAELAREKGLLAGCVFVDYGHPAQIMEGWKAFAYCGSRGIPLKALHAFGLDLGDMRAGQGARVVPNRNAILIGLAANAAPSMGAGAVTVGVTAEDQEEYADCRRSFLDHMSAALGVAVFSPLIGASKPEIIAEARRLGLSPSDAWSCYGPGPIPCEACPCCERAKAWTAEPAGVTP